MKHWILAAATLLLAQGVDARDHWGPPSACPQPKADCCPKPCEPKCETKPKPFTKPKCEPKPCKPVCDPCCPPVCFERGLESSPCCITPAYSEPAAIELRCGWDIFANVNFIYWDAMQGGMDLAIPGQATIVGGTITTTTVGVSATGKSMIFQDTDYKPGFQIGLGWAGAKDNWVVYAEYTWLHGSTHTSESAPAPDVASINGIALPQSGIWIPSSLFSGVFSNRYANHISSKWKYKIDLLDAQLSRPFYSGTRFTLEPFFGLRAAWIRQNLHLTATNLATTGVATTGPSRQGHYSSRSAAVGPRVGMNGNWFFGYGIRFIGDVSTSLLFTGYDVKQNLDSPDVSSGSDPFPVKVKMDDYNALRPNLDLSLGLGWGSYFLCRRMHWDISATYDFSIFWEQNMIRNLADLTCGTFSDHSSYAGDLYLQGLTIKTQFDF